MTLGYEGMAYFYDFYNKTNEADTSWHNCTTHVQYLKIAALRIPNITNTKNKYNKISKDNDSLDFFFLPDLKENRKLFQVLILL